MLKAGGAALITEPGDVLEILRGPARHSFDGTHAARFGHADADSSDSFTPSMFSQEKPGMNEIQRRIVHALQSPMSIDELGLHTGLEPARVRAELTTLELLRVVKRSGTRVERA